MEKSTAAKSQAKPPPQDAPAVPAFDAGANEVTPPSDKRLREKTPDAKQLNDCRTYFNRVADGKHKKATAGQIEDARIALSILRESPEDMKKEFAGKFNDSKTHKSFGWVKTFKEEMKSRTTRQQGTIENYYTRTGSHF